MTCAPLAASVPSSVDVAVLTFDAEGSTLVMTALRDLVGRAIIRIVELGVVEMADDGSVRQLSEIELFGSDGVIAPPLLAGTMPTVAERLTPGTSAMVVVWENIWAERLTTALRDAGGNLVETTSSVFEVCGAA